MDYYIRNLTEVIAVKIATFIGNVQDIVRRTAINIIRKLGHFFSTIS